MNDLQKSKIFRKAVEEKLGGKISNNNWEKYQPPIWWFPCDDED